MERLYPDGRRGHWLADGVILLGIVALWMICVTIVTGGRRVVLWDTYRDMAWAENIRAGRVWTDPTLPGLPYWYAPGGALLVGGLSRLTGLRVVDLYMHVGYWLNVFVPLMLYILVRVVWSRAVAVVALLTVYCGSLLWLTHAAAALPSIQGVALDLGTLLCWHRCVVQRDQKRWLVAALSAGAVLALTAWYHPLCAMVPAGAMLLHAVIHVVAPGLGRPTAPADRLDILRKLLLVGVVAGVLASPLTVHMVAMQRANPATVRYFAEELYLPEFYAQALAPLVLPCALLGVWLVTRHAPAAIWIVTYLTVGLLGQLVAFLAQVPGWKMPFLLPHEFVWHTQLALGICAAIGLVGLATRIAQAVSRRRHLWPVRALCLAGLTLVVVGPGARGRAQADRYLMDIGPLLAHTAELRTWIRKNTTLDAVFVCPPDAGYRIVAGMTGRKCIASSPGHTNPLVDVARRHDDVKTMIEATDPAEFSRLAAKYNATHLLLVNEPGDQTPVVQPRYQTWPCLRLAFVSRDGTSAVWEIIPATDAPGSKTRPAEARR